MVGLVIATHGRLAEELLATARQIVGPVDNVATCQVEPGASAEALRSQVCAAVQAVEQGDGVIVLADLLGGSPCTQSLTLCSQQKLEVLTGVNLPMLLKASSLRLQQVPLAELANQLAAYGQKNIANASALLRGARPSAA
ncbi:MAG: PTS sugar transporter subunit IIA [Myxococcaceae bacterium]|nr:PTS sugar transporter subunit IIA [Myxococcaceae bacterium]